MIIYRFSSGISAVERAISRAATRGSLSARYLTRSPLSTRSNVSLLQTYADRQSLLKLQKKARKKAE